MSQPSRIPRISLSGFYLFYFGVLGAFIPYFSLYLENRGFNAGQIGFLLAIPALTKLLSPALWAWVARREAGHLLQLIRLASFLSLTGFMLLLWPWGVAGVAAVMFFYTVFQNGIMPLFDTLTLDYLDSDSHGYARIRIWGSVGFILTVILLGEMLEHQFPVAALPYVISLLLGGVWVVSLAVPRGAHRPHPPATETLAGIIERREVIAFFLACMLLQFSHGPYYVFYSVYLEDHGYGKRETGWLWSMGVFAEIILFVYMPVILKHFSLRQIFVTSLLLGALRWYLLGVLVESGIALVLIQCLHAASFGSAHVAAVHLVQHYFQGIHHGSGQTLYSSVSYGLGGMLGSFTAGYFWDSLGAEWVYTLAATASLAGGLIAWYGLRPADGH